MADITEGKGFTRIKRIVVVSSGKGGVGKSTIAVQLAMHAYRRHFSVGLLDLDLTGPSVPLMVGLVQQRAHQMPEGQLVPVFADKDRRFAILSVGSVLPDAAAGVALRGPRKDSVVTKFIEAQWGERDVLVIDMPPGTADEKMTTARILLNEYREQFAGAVLVTTPQMVALSDVRKEISFWQKAGLPVLGLIENMSGLLCPQCNSFERVFSVGGGEALAKLRDIPFIGTLPLLPTVAEVSDGNQTFEEKLAVVDSAVLAVLDKIVNELTNHDE